MYAEIVLRKALKSMFCLRYMVAQNIRRTWPESLDFPEKPGFT